ncbi:MAG: ATP-dependent zinc metalloprotease FtsH [Chloroflexi bacterium]|uniref:ATP-dependent zinc metalloprotease FtsH n=1 Tax=Candidatus Chlorohelix allophototropha TaxID=3003348 RepID=A0A8T7LSY3_9CHLR|nr:ATP-dependent zinc metalloprotease FtsH [Chloroflexota bacterium]WJW67013.1 ATP-dependent zinc metalloprotease FtsH [Chloroflexota bacterium L227-S17]
MGENKWLRNSFVYLIIMVAVLALFFTILGNGSKDSNNTITLGEVIRTAADPNQSSKIKEIVITNDSDVGRIRYTDGTEKVFRRETGVTDFGSLLRNAGVDLTKSSFNLKVNESSQWGGILNTLTFLLPTLLFIGVLVFMMRQAQGSNNQALSFGKSRARMFMGNKPSVTFNDVAGADEAKQELAEVVEFLKYPDKFAALGARIPKGVLLVGPPGTGKTLLSKAVAGEAGVPFFSISGSEFVEMFVGVGASRVRDLFDQAKRNSPCIIFIDEIDAVGRQRGAGLGGSHDEREQTLNQILVEMDGFDSNTNVIMIAATNRPDVLDPALLRPGRFDRQVVLDRPDIRGRMAILDVHSRGKPFDKEVSMETLAKQTPGFSGADLENLINEAAILAARRNKKSISMSELEEAIDRVIAGPERKSRVISDKEKAITAYHEVGHALVARMLANVDPVHKISIIPRGMAGGYTRVLPSEDRFLGTKAQFEDQIAWGLGGRAAEEIIFNEISSGASNDIEKSTDMARRMVTQYGMSKKLGPVAFGQKDELIFLGREISEQRNYSDEIAYEIDKEVRSIIDANYQRAKKILGENREKLIEVAELLIQRETLEGEDFEAMFDTKRPEPKPLFRVEPAALNEGQAAAAIYKDQIIPGALRPATGSA